MKNNEVCKIATKALGNYLHSTGFLFDNLVIKVSVMCPHAFLLHCNDSEENRGKCGNK